MPCTPHSHRPITPACWGHERACSVWSASIIPSFLCGAETPQTPGQRRVEGGRLVHPGQPGHHGEGDTPETPPHPNPLAKHAVLAASAWEPTFSSDGPFLSKKTNSDLRWHLFRGIQGLCKDCGRPATCLARKRLHFPQEHAVNIKFSEASSTLARSTEWIPCSHTGAKQAPHVPPSSSRVHLGVWATPYKAESNSSVQRVPALNPPVYHRPSHPNIPPKKGRPAQKASFCHSPASQAGPP